MNQLFYNIAGGIVHQIRSEKRTRISEVIVRVKRNIKQNRNWFYFKFSAESSSFIFNNFKTEKFKLSFEGWNRPVCHLFSFTRVSDSEANRVGADVESPFPLFFSFSASFKHSSPREKVGKLSSESLFLSIMVAKYLNIFPHANNGRSREKKFWQSDLLTPSECTIEIWSTRTLLNLIAWLC